MKTSRFMGAVCILVASAALATLLRAQQTPNTSDDTRAYFEVLRSQFNSNKVATYNQALKLTPAEAEKFWPIYRAYEKELGALGDQKLQLIRDFFKHYSAGDLTDANSKDLAERWLSNLEARTALWRKYHGQISEALSPTRGAQFLQLENQIAIFMDLAIASEMPTLAPGISDGAISARPADTNAKSP